MLLRCRRRGAYVIGKTLHRSGLVLHHRLVRHLSGVARLQARGEPAGFWVPFLAADLGNFFRRRRLERAHQARLVRGRRAQGIVLFGGSG